MSCLNFNRRSSAFIGGRKRLCPLLILAAPRRPDRSPHRAFRVRYHLLSTGSMQPAHRTPYEFGPFRFDATERLLYRGAEVVPLTPRVADIPWVLLSHKGSVVGKASLLHLVLPDTSMRRKAREDDVDGCRYVESIPKRGYRFAARIDGAAPPLVGRQPRRRWVTTSGLAAGLTSHSRVAHQASHQQPCEHGNPRPPWPLWPAPIHRSDSGPQIGGQASPCPRSRAWPMQPGR